MAKNISASRSRLQLLAPCGYYRAFWLMPDTPGERFADFSVYRGGLANRQHVRTGVNMRKLILGAASVLALAIGGAALDYVADAGTATDIGTVRPAFETSQSSRTAAFLRKDNIRWAQLELRNMGLYGGSLDGIEGPETKRALDQFQRNSGLKPTAMLDPQTLDALIGKPGTGSGSSTSPDAGRAKSMTNPPGSSSNLGN